MINTPDSTKQVISGFKMKTFFQGKCLSMGLGAWHAFCDVIIIEFKNAQVYAQDARCDLSVWMKVLDKQTNKQTNKSN